MAEWDPASGAASLRVHGTNAHHDVTWLADSAGAVSSSLRYDPWGVPRTAVPTGYTPFRFQGSWHDASTDLAWVITRWYAPSLGTFMSEDSLLGEPRDPDSRHLYAYAQGEPVGRWDPDGRWGRCLSDPLAGVFKPCLVKTVKVSWEQWKLLVIGVAAGLFCTAAGVVAADVTAASLGSAAGVAGLFVQTVCGGAMDVWSWSWAAAGSVTRYRIYLGNPNSWVVAATVDEHGVPISTHVSYYYPRKGRSARDCAISLGYNTDWLGIRAGACEFILRRRDYPLPRREYRR